MQPSGLNNNARALLLQVLKNVPNLVDVHNKIALLQSLGMSIAYQADSDMGGHVVARADALTSGAPCAHLVQQLRSSFLIAGVLLRVQGALCACLRRVEQHDCLAGRQEHPRL